MGAVRKIGKYQILSTLGQGAMGVVYKAFDPLIERTVALKTIRKDVMDAKELEPLLTRFKQEAQAAGRLTHPGIVTVYEYGEDEGTVFIAMEFVPGRELKQILDNNEHLPPVKAVNLIDQLLDALDYSHANGVVHRDIKPGNIFILQDGRIKVTDFGIAKIESSTLTQCGEVFGTPSYMSPEQFTGEPVDRRSDLFSVGVILYHLLTGEKPFPGSTMPTIMHRVLNTSPPKISEVNGRLSTGFDQLLNTALAKKAADRFQTARAFADALKLAYQASADKIGESGGEVTTLNYAPQDEATLFQADFSGASATVPGPAPVDASAELTVNTAGGSNFPQASTQAPSPQGNPWGRRLLLAIPTLIALSICSYLLWMIASNNQRREAIPPVDQAQLGEPRKAAAAPPQAAALPAPIPALKKRPESEPGAKTVVIPPPIEEAAPPVIPSVSGPRLGAEPSPKAVAAAPGLPQMKIKAPEEPKETEPYAKWP